METFVVRVWLPDRPGALGQVASRIGAVRGDVVGIDILERGGGQAVDELVVGMPDGSSIELLVSEISQVDGVAVEDVRRVAADRPDGGLFALGMAAELAECEPTERLELLCRQVGELVDADWVVALDRKGTLPLVVHGASPDTGWLAAFIDGSRHLSDEAQAAGAPGDLGWGRLPAVDVVVALGRTGRPIHTRERQQIGLLCRVADALMGVVLLNPA
ncbi:MAG: hypothetical protein WEB78_04630 [Ilumatobacteraceae bacterium]